MNHKFFLLALPIAFLASCSNAHQETNNGSADTVETDPLPSWKDTQTKSNIVSFVENVSNPSHEDFVEPKDRIATFDNDGTLWAEQPAYFQLFFAIDEVKAMMADHPEWKDQHPYKEVYENDLKGLAEYGKKGLIQLVLASHSNMSNDQFAENVANWMNTAQHPTKKVKYTDLVYQPMLELIRYLEANEFTVFIVSGSGIDFMRVFVEKAYGLPTHQVVGSSLKAEFQADGDNFFLVKVGELDFIDDKEGKPVAIHKHIGKKPIFACGNSDGDLQMMQYAWSNTLPNFELYIHHTDEEREWKYDSESHIGRLSKGLEEAEQKGWTVADIKNDWNTVFNIDSN